MAGHRKGAIIHYGRVIETGYGAFVTIGKDTIAVSPGNQRIILAPLDKNGGVNCDTTIERSYGAFVIIDQETITISPGAQEIILATTGKELFKTPQGNDPVQVYTSQMLQDLLAETNEGSQLERGPCKGAYKLTEGGIVHVIGPVDLSYKFNYLVSDKKAPPTDSIDEKIIDLCAEDNSASLKLPPKHVISYRIAHRIFDGSREMAELRDSLGSKGRYWVETEKVRKTADTFRASDGQKHSETRDKPYYALWARNL